MCCVIFNLYCDSKPVVFLLFCCLCVNVSLVRVAHLQFFYFSTSLCVIQGLRACVDSLQIHFVRHKKQDPFRAATCDYHGTWFVSDFYSLVPLSSMQTQIKMFCVLAREVLLGENLFHDMNVL